MILALPRRGPTISVWPPLPLPRTRLGQCLALALLLHLWLVLTIGTAPGGSAAPGEGVWGRLNTALSITLTGPPSPAVETPPQAAPIPVDSGPTGAAPKRRQGGSVRPVQRPAPSPGAAELGRWNATPAEQLNGPAPEPEAPAPVPAAAPEPEPTIRTQEAAPVTVQRLQKPALPAPSRSSTDNKSAPDLLKPLPAAAPVEAPPAPVPAPPDLRTLPEPEAIPARRAPAELPQTITPPALQSQPLSAPKAQPQVTAPVAPINPGVTPQVAPGAAPSANTSQPAAPSLVPALPPVGAPDAGTQRGHDVATSPSASASSPRTPLDLRMPVNRPVARQGGDSMLNLMPHPPDAKAKLGEDMKKAGRGDCRDEHAANGLLAVVPLAVDTARDKGCKW
ncbi:hypothetical protein SNE35_13455 [Paucibacter sp. R3-3]|uniref:ESPR domain-containing protein n=1 Tax=Roseateles agri TaxID=3098619 RepID=A0ABU5DGV7_9BURK|nr:hypothetical protein [Paucibacter sp. R3-3]MDY0745521.1 hypothetical protein [Paucibacter sp. R3-3]